MGGGIADRMPMQFAFVWKIVQNQEKSSHFIDLICK